MNERVQKLRRQSVETKPYISAERAALVTDFYQIALNKAQSMHQEQQL